MLVVSEATVIKGANSVVTGAVCSWFNVLDPDVES